MKILLLAIVLLKPMWASNLVSDINLSRSCIHDLSSFKCVTYLRNYDGDTITFDIDRIHPLFGQKINVRLFGVDTPEIRTKNKCEKKQARVAKNLVSNLLKSAKRIDLENVKRDKYFRILADIKFDGKDLKTILLKNNLAYVYYGKTKFRQNWCNLGRGLANQKK